MMETIVWFFRIEMARMYKLRSFSSVNVLTQTTWKIRFDENHRRRLQIMSKSFDSTECDARSEDY